MAGPEVDRLYVNLSGGECGCVLLLCLARAVSAVSVLGDCVSSVFGFLRTPLSSVHC